VYIGDGYNKVSLIAYLLVDLTLIGEQAKFSLIQLNSKYIVFLFSSNEEKPF